VQKITKDAAECAIEKLSLGDKNRAFVGYWLSLWQGDALPRLERFDIARLPAQAPGMVVFDVIPERRVLIRSAGSDICRAVGLPLDGIDWVAYAPLRNQKLRMQNLSEVANGSLLLARRPFLHSKIGRRVNEELVLPFAPDANGVSPAIACIDWKLDEPDWFKSVTDISGVAHDRMMRLRRRKSPSRDMEAA
jgi:PAS domain-containing protein